MGTVLAFKPHEQPQPEQQPKRKRKLLLVDAHSPQLFDWVAVRYEHAKGCEILHGVDNEMETNEITHGQTTNRR
jgi:hypothetical protein